MEIIDRRCCFLNNLPKVLKEEYEYCLSQCADFEGIVHPKINVSDVLSAHFVLADYFTDKTAGENVEKMLVGVRDFNLLASAIGRQVIEFGGKQKYTQPLEICATLFYGLVKNHGFHDGNKRTALLVLLYQMYLYNLYPKTMLKEFEKLVVHVADNSIDTYYFKYYKKYKKENDPEIKTIVHILRRLSVKKNTRIHDNVTMKELISALEKAGVEVTRINKTIKLKRKVRFRRPYQYALNYYGETRNVGKKALGDVYNNLKLSELYPSVNEFISGAQPMYTLVNEFAQPLRRLKDK